MKEEQELSTTAKPPFVDNQKGVPLNELSAFLLDINLNEKEALFVRDLWHDVSHTDKLSIHKVARHLDKTADTIRKRLEKLVEVGVFSKYEKRYQSANRPAIHYRFECRHKVQEVIQRPAVNINRLGKMMVNTAINKQLMDTRIDDLVCSALFAALPPREIRVMPKDGLKAIINWFEQQVPVFTRVATGKQVASIADLRYYIACLSLCYEIVQSNLVLGDFIENSFAIDIGAINGFLGKANKGGDISSAKSALERLGFTSVEVPNLPKNVIERFGFESANININPLANIGFFTEKKVNDQQKHFVVFQLPTPVFQSMLHERFMFVINPQVLSVKQPIMLAFHFWCRRRIGHKSTTFVTSLGRLNRDVSPLLPFAEFQKDLIQAIEVKLKAHVTEISDKGLTVESRKQYIKVVDKKLFECNVCLFGYWLNIKDGVKVFINTDAKDAYVGLASKHRQALKRLGDTSAEQLGISFDAR